MQQDAVWYRRYGGPADRAAARALDPIPQDEPPGEPIAAISYSAPAAEAFGRLRAAMQRPHRDGVTLAATEDAIEANPASYTAWQVRWESIVAARPSLLLPSSVSAASTSSPLVLSRDALLVSFRGYLSLLDRELAHLSEFGEDTPKNYQIWNHRRKVAEELSHTHQAIAALLPQETSAELPTMEKNLKATMEATSLGDDGKAPSPPPPPPPPTRCTLVASARAVAMHELAWCAHVLLDDAKNYHAWSHRQAFVRLAAAWEEELIYTTMLLQIDVCNNSAWNERIWVLNTLMQDCTCEEAMRVAWRAVTDHHGGGERKLEEETSSSSSPHEIAARVFEHEVEFTFSLIALIPNNESAWNHLRALLALPCALASSSSSSPSASSSFLPSSSPSHASLARLAPLLLPNIERVLRAEPSCPAALSFLLDCLESVLEEWGGMIRAAEGGGGGGRAMEAMRDRWNAAQERARSVCDALCIADPIRIAYWTARREHVINGLLSRA